MTKIIDEIQTLLTERGEGLYGGEAVTQTEHALQCATLAEAEGAQPGLIAAALLHDIGHFLETDFHLGLNMSEDQYHENLGEAFLTEWFKSEVTDPVKLHVAAKRYLCTVDDQYFDCLSAASVKSLQLQGGPMSRWDVEAFEANVHWRDAVRLRKWDDRAKDPKAKTPDVAHFLTFLELSLKTRTVA